MIYCENTSCRRKDILGYFGKSFLEKNCNGCDICLNLPDIQADVKDKSLIFEEVKEDINYDQILKRQPNAIRSRLRKQGLN